MKACRECLNCIDDLEGDKYTDHDKAYIHDRIEHGAEFDVVKRKDFYKCATHKKIRFNFYTGEIVETGYLCCAEVNSDPFQDCVSFKYSGALFSPTPKGLWVDNAKNDKFIASKKPGYMGNVSPLGCDPDIE